LPLHTRGNYSLLCVAERIGARPTRTLKSLFERASARVARDTFSAMRRTNSSYAGLFAPGGFDIGRVLEELSSVGATSVKILDEDFRVALLKEAEGYDYKPEDEIVGSGDRLVRQQVSSFDDLPEGSGYVLLKNSFQDLLERRLADAESYLFETALNFNSMVLQRYEKGSIGITPHRDGLSYVNLVCVFVIRGRGRFYVCSDRSGRDAREIDASPGNVILMRAPGLFGSEDNRPFHYVTDIQETRYSFGLRQRRSVVDDKP
jgi:hypothetical protein